MCVADETEKDYSDPEFDTSTKFVNDDNDDDDESKLNEDTTPDVVSGLNEVRDSKQLLDGYCLFSNFFFFQKKLI